MRGIYKFKLQHREVCFKFGTYAMAIACKKDECDLTTFLKRVGLGAVKKDEPKPEIVELSLFHLFYGAAVNYYDSINKDIDFTASEVGDWLDQIGYDQVIKTYMDAFYTFVPKNSEAPKETGQTTTSALRTTADMQSVI